MTLDSDGIAMVTADGTSQLLPTRRREVYDITGAGDMVLAMIGVGAAAGIEPVDVARLANIAGGLEVEQIGVVTISRKEILADLVAAGRSTHEKICRLDDLSRHVAARRKLPIHEYAPRKVKQAVVGNGNATKEQVRFMVERMVVHLAEGDGALDEEWSLDATDALAVAICHLHASQGSLSASVRGL